MIADRNPHVREFLKREMTSAGYRVHLAVSGIQILNWVSHHRADMVIIDPDLPDYDSLSLFEKLRDQQPHLPIVIHAFLSDYVDYPTIFHNAIWVEKGESSAEQLKEVIADVLSSQEKKEIA